MHYLKVIPNSFLKLLLRLDDAILNSAQRAVRFKIKQRLRVIPEPVEVVPELVEWSSESVPKCPLSLPKGVSNASECSLSLPKCPLSLSKGFACL